MFSLDEFEEIKEDFKLEKLLNRIRKHTKSLLEYGIKSSIIILKLHGKYLLPDGFYPMFLKISLTRPNMELYLPLIETKVHLDG